MSLVEFIHEGNRIRIQFYALLLNICIIFRALWDLYLRPLNQPGSSRIPKGWVKPSQPSSREWRKYLVVSANRKRKGDNLNSMLNVEKMKQPNKKVS